MTQEEFKTLKVGGMVQMTTVHSSTHGEQDGVYTIVDIDWTSKRVALDRCKCKDPYNHLNYQWDEYYLLTYFSIYTGPITVSEAEAKSAIPLPSTDAVYSFMTRKQ